MKDQGGIPEDLKQKADNAYCSFIEEMRKPGCLGAEYKIERGIFTKDNLEAFKKAYTLYGKHVAYSDAEQIVASQAQQISDLRAENNELRSKLEGSGADNAGRILPALEERA